jgi:hypothetical protein
VIIYYEKEILLIIIKHRCKNKKIRKVEHDWEDKCSSRKEK